MNQKSQSIFIKCLMCAHELSGTEIARQCGFSRAQVSKVISGQSRSTQVEQALSRILGKPLGVLFPTWYTLDGKRFRPTRLTADERLQAMSAFTQVYSTHAQEAA